MPELDILKIAYLFRFSLDQFSLIKFDAELIYVIIIIPFQYGTVPYRISVTKAVLEEGKGQVM